MYVKHMDGKDKHQFLRMVIMVAGERKEASVVTSIFISLNKK